MSTSEPDKDLKFALDAFETALVTPVVSGELATWSDGVRATWTKLSPLVEQHVSQLHPKQYEEMTQQDPEIFAQVDKLKSEDAALQVQHQKIGELIDLLVNLAPLVEPDESKFNDLRARLQKDGVALVTRSRQQQVAVQTWYLEAFNRDRGIVD